MTHRQNWWGGAKSYQSTTVSWHYKKYVNLWPSLSDPSWIGRKFMAISLGRAQTLKLLTPNGHKADKSDQRPYFYLITTNINGHEVVNVDALVLIAMTRRHLISFAYVSCPCVNFCPRLWSNLYFRHSKNSPKNLINSLGHVFVKYVKILPCLVQK